MILGKHSSFLRLDTCSWRTKIHIAIFFVYDILLTFWYSVTFKPFVFDWSVEVLSRLSFTNTFIFSLHGCGNDGIVSRSCRESRKDALNHICKDLFWIIECKVGNAIPISVAFRNYILVYTKLYRVYMIWVSSNLFKIFYVITRNMYTWLIEGKKSL